MKKVMKVIIGILLVIVIGIGGIGYMQHKEHEKMVAIATSEEARKVYEDKIRREESVAFTNQGVIRTYKIDEASLEYNPMGGLMVDVFINDDREAYISFNLIDNGDGTYSSAYYIISVKFNHLLEME
ncbi:DUF1310 family protein [Streptococcus suis]|uniref:DUF1310 family protein n=1 Tax=Streptococcus suis TaxID=1307 RepID=UPI001CF10024|nr:DUF1310 family protein [Streptococcus suis]MCB2966953.1 DUF1310 family protein [Streptococcus suis]